MSNFQMSADFIEGNTVCTTYEDPGSELRQFSYCPPILSKEIQLNDYEIAPYFIQFRQNLTCDCLLISVFSPKFT